MTLEDLIQAAIQEDMPAGDLTTQSLALKTHVGRAKLIAKQDLILSGIPAFEKSILALDPSAKLKWHFQEGDPVLSKQILCSLQGDLIQILKAERIALNFLLHLTGIATLTSQFVKQVEGTQTKILDTRKTLPGYRELEKKAVFHGGGQNHRMNLSAAIMLKDNHISVMGGITAAVQQTRKHTEAPIEVEVGNLDEVKEAVELKVRRILLDNMNNDQIQSSLRLIPSTIETEASGNMSLDRVRSVAQLGVNFISVGALTHSAPAADISLMFQWEKNP